jgi:hypothetical protein
MHATRVYFNFLQQIAWNYSPRVFILLFVSFKDHEFYIAHANESYVSVWKEIIVTYLYLYSLYKPKGRGIDS